MSVSSGSRPLRRRSWQGAVQAKETRARRRECSRRVRGDVRHWRCRQQLRPGTDVFNPCGDHTRMLIHSQSSNKRQCDDTGWGLLRKKTAFCWFSIGVSSPTPPHNAHPITSQLTSHHNLIPQSFHSCTATTSSHLTSAHPSRLAESEPEKLTTGKISASLPRHTGEVRVGSRDTIQFRLPCEQAND